MTIFGVLEYWSIGVLRLVRCITQLLQQTGLCTREDLLADTVTGPTFDQDTLHLAAER